MGLREGAPRASPSFDHLVGAGEDRRRHREPERPCTPLEGSSAVLLESIPAVGWHLACRLTDTLQSRPNPPQATERNECSAVWRNQRNGSNGGWPRSSLLMWRATRA